MAQICYTAQMEIIELTNENISDYLQSCLKLQKQLIGDKRVPAPEFFKLAAADSHSYFLALVENVK